MANNALTAAELRGLSGKELNAQVLALKEELFNLRFQSATGQLQSTKWRHILDVDIGELASAKPVPRQGPHSIDQGYDSPHYKEITTADRHRTVTGVPTGTCS